MRSSSSRDDGDGRVWPSLGDGGDSTKESTLTSGLLIRVRVAVNPSGGWSDSQRSEVEVACVGDAAASLQEVRGRGRGRVKRRDSLRSSSDGG